MEPLGVTGVRPVEITVAPAAAVVVAGPIPGAVAFRVRVTVGHVHVAKGGGDPGCLVDARVRRRHDLVPAPDQVDPPHVDVVAGAQVGHVPYEAARVVLVPGEVEAGVGVADRGRRLVEGRPGEVGPVEEQVVVAGDDRRVDPVVGVVGVAAQRQVGDGVRADVVDLLAGVDVVNVAGEDVVAAHVHLLRLRVEGVGDPRVATGDRHADPAGGAEPVSLYPAGAVIGGNVDRPAVVPRHRSEDVVGLGVEVEDHFVGVFTGSADAYVRVPALLGADDGLGPADGDSKARARGLELLESGQGLVVSALIPPRGDLGRPGELRGRALRTDGLELDVRVGSGRLVEPGQDLCRRGVRGGLVGFHVLRGCGAQTTDPGRGRCRIECAVVHRPGLRLCECRSRTIQRRRSSHRQAAVVHGLGQARRRRRQQHEDDREQISGSSHGPVSFPDGPASGTDSEVPIRRSRST